MNPPHLPQIYRTEPVANNLLREQLFVSKVEYQGKVYEGAAKSSKKGAEHVAAQLCLYKNKMIDIPPEFYDEAIEQIRQPHTGNE